MTGDLPIATSEDGDKGKAASACNVCRRRKIKCGKELPHCLLCQQNSLQCDYPRELRRRGPKIGSTQKLRRRQRQHPRGRPGAFDIPYKAPIEIREPHTQLQPPVVQQSASLVTQLPQPPTRNISASTPNMQSLSFILHPSHESYSPGDRSIQSPSGDAPSSEQNHIAASCQDLGFEPGHLRELVALYFETSNAFQLFRPQDFEAKLNRIATLAQTKALLAAVLALALKGVDENADNESNIGPRLPPGCAPLSTSHLSNLARQSLNVAISECEDESLPFCVLQALILVTHCLLVQGVGGRASRYLGICIQSAYQLNLHLVDAGHLSGETTLDAVRWCEDEERRRAWWAIWDMDVLASVIGRCPASIDWSLNETFLPAEDERWDRSEPQASCHLDHDISKRWKALSSTGNKSPRAWLSVVSSYVKDAQRITSPTAVEGPHQKGTDAAMNRLMALLNNLHCTSVWMPEELKYRYQYLHFGSREPNRMKATADRLQHASIYSTHCLIQLAKLMINRYWIFQSVKTGSFSDNDKHRPPGYVSNDNSWHGRLEFPDRGRPPANASLALNQYLEASDEVCTLVRRSYEDHYKYVQPYLANTIWLAGAVQLFHKLLVPSTTTGQELIISNFQVLNTTYKRFSQYWNISKTLQNNLEVVESELEAFDGQQLRNKSVHDEILALLGTDRGNSTSSISSNGNGTMDNALLQPGCLSSSRGQREIHGQGHESKETSVDLGGDTRTSIGAMASDALAQQVSYEDWTTPSQPRQEMPFVPHQGQLERISCTQSSNNPPLALETSNILMQGLAETSFTPQVGDSHGFSKSCFESSLMPLPEDLSQLTPPNVEFANYLEKMLSGSYSTI
ncbi:hypothetical protein ACHAP5_006224 [Fusarium lateritium]